MKLQGFDYLLIYFFLVLFYAVWYFPVRKRLILGTRYQIFLLANMIYGLGVMLLFPLVGSKICDVSSQPLTFCLTIMVIAGFLHHTSLLLIFRSKREHRLIEIIHGPISHLLIGIPFIFAGIFAVSAFYPRVVTTSDLIVFSLWFVEMGSFGILMILLGLKRIKLSGNIR